MQSDGDLRRAGFGVRDGVRSATDNAGNDASNSVGFPFDATPPTIAVDTPPDGAVYLLNQAIAGSYGCGDNLSGVGACAGPAANGANVDTATVGRKEFRVNASDVAGNHASRVHSYDVQYVFEGFFQPVDNLPIVNVANAGRTVPLKWRLTDANGALIADPGSFLSLLSTPIACDASPSVTLEEEIGALDATVLKFTGTDWHYNWKTSSGWSGCRLLQLTLADGAQHVARFEFR